MMKRLWIISIILLFSSCTFIQQDGIAFNIINQSDETISNIEFSTTENQEIIKINTLNPSEHDSQFLSMKMNKTDGAYLLTFDKANGEKVQNNNGYYSNGVPLNKTINYVIKNDTIIVKYDNLGH